VAIHPTFVRWAAMYDPAWTSTIHLCWSLPLLRWQTGYSPFDWFSDEPMAAVGSHDRRASTRRQPAHVVFSNSGMSLKGSQFG